MKILLFGEYSGLFNCLKEGLVTLGHDVFLASNGEGYRNWDSDLRYDSKMNLGKANHIIEIYNLFVNYKLLKGYDVVYIVGPELFSQYKWPNKIVYDFIINNNNKVYLCGAGISGKLFDFWYDSEGSKYHDYMAGYLEELNNPNSFKYNHNKKICAWEDELMQKIDGYIPIWYEYAEPFRTYERLKPTIRIPINLSKFKYKPNVVKDKIIFFHGLSRPCKGGKFIIEAFDKLREKYINEAEFICAGGLPFTDYMLLIDRVNVILDDVNSYSIAMNGLFSMAKGKIVMGGAEPEGNRELNYGYSPVINLNKNVDQICSCIEDIIQRRDEIEQMGLNSRLFVEEYHDFIKIAKEYEKLWTQELKK